MDEMRAMLDDLMGKHRDVPLKEREKYTYVIYLTLVSLTWLRFHLFPCLCRKRKRFYDSSICKYHICGLCPYEEFKKTKNDLGSCPREHDAECLEEWNKLTDKEKERYGYERDLKRWLDRLLSDLEKKKEVNFARIKGSQKKTYSQEEQSSLDAMDRQIEELLIEAQNQGEQGDVDAAESLVEQAETVRKQKNTLKSTLDNKLAANVSKGLVQTVCPVSGLILNDEEARLQDHHSGRNYTAWKKVHEKHAELEALFKKRRDTFRKSERSRSPMHRSRGRGQDHVRENKLLHTKEVARQSKDESSEEEEGQVV